MCCLFLLVLGDAFGRQPVGAIPKMAAKGVLEPKGVAPFAFIQIAARSNMHSRSQAWSPLQCTEKSNMQTEISRQSQFSAGISRAKFGARSRREALDECQFRRLSKGVARFHFAFRTARAWLVTQLGGFASSQNTAM